MRPKILLLLFCLFCLGKLSANDYQIGSLSFKSNNPDIVPLAEKYFSLQKGSKTDIQSLRSAIEALQTELQKQGYLYIDIPFPEIIPRTDDTFDITFIITEVQQAQIRSFAFWGMRYFSDAKLKDLLLLPAAGFAFNDIPHIMDKILSLYLNRAYLFAKIELDSLSTISIDGERALRAVFRIDEGKPFALQKVVFQGNKNTRDETLVSISGLNRQALITPPILATAQQNILRKPYIRDCKILPLDENTLLIEIEEGRMSYLEGVLGYNENREGKRELSGTGKLRFLNLWGSDRAILIYWKKLPSGTSELELSYHESGTTAIPLAADLSLYRMVQDSTWIKTKTTVDVYYPWLYHKLGIVIGIESISPGSRRPIQIEKDASKSLGAIWSYTNTDDPYNPSGGLVSDLRYKFVWRNRNTNLKPQNALELNMENYHRLSKRWTLSAGTHLRHLNDDQARIYEQFKMGGFASLRGFADDAFSSWFLGWSNLEFRYRITPESRVFAFVDHGYYAQSKNSIDFEIMSFGLGLKVLTKIGLLSIEYALGYRDNTLSDIEMGMIHLGIDAGL